MHIRIFRWYIKCMFIHKGWRELKNYLLFVVQISKEIIYLSSDYFCPWFYIQYKIARLWEKLMLPSYALDKRGFKIVKWSYNILYLLLMRIMSIQILKKVYIFFPYVRTFSIYLKNKRACFIITGIHANCNISWIQEISMV